MTDEMIENVLVDAYTKIMRKVCDLDSSAEKYSLINVLYELDNAMNGGVEYLSKF